MVREIRVYIEGSGKNASNTKSALREGFSYFFKDLKQEAKERKIEFRLILCGSGSVAFKDFQRAIETHRDAINILLIDAEVPVKKQSPWQHLQITQNWQISNLDDDYCHLMVQVMEAWLIADIQALKNYYGQGFKDNLIPKNPNVEEVSKDDLMRKLKEATRNTSKGEYHKIHHASELLQRLEVAKVRKASYYCDRLFNTLTTLITSPA